MSIAEVLYAQYKVLPAEVQEELLNLINQERAAQKEFSDKIEKIKNQPKRPMQAILKNLDNAVEEVMIEKGITISDVDKAAKAINKNRTEFKRDLRKKYESSN